MKLSPTLKKDEAKKEREKTEDEAQDEDEVLAMQKEKREKKGKAEKGKKGQKKRRKKHMSAKNRQAAAQPFAARRGNTLAWLGRVGRGWPMTVENMEPLRVGAKFTANRRAPCGVTRGNLAYENPPVPGRCGAARSGLPDGEIC